MPEFDNELYLEMMQNEAEEQPKYYEEDNCYLPVFNSVINNYYA